VLPGRQEWAATAGRLDRPTHRPRARPGPRSPGPGVERRNQRPVAPACGPSLHGPSPPWPLAVARRRGPAGPARDIARSSAPGLGTPGHRGPPRTRLGHRRP
jgi:hypothetical protein